MNRGEFQIQTQRLCELYSKNLNETQTEFWYNSLNKYDILVYRRAIGEYAKCNKYMPTISDILSTIKKLKKYTKEASKEEQSKVPCSKCYCSGLIKYINNGYEYLCTCTCKNGQRRKEELPQLLTWKEVFPYVTNEMVLPKATATTATTSTTTSQITTSLGYDLSQINF